MKLRTFISILLHLLGSIFLLAAVVLIAAWLTGIIFSDRWVWSQWLSWIPTIILMPAGGLWLIGIGLMRRFRRYWQPGICLLVLGPFVYLYLHWQPERTHADESRPGITFCQWTLGTVLANEEAYGEVLVELDADVSLVEGGRRIRWSQPIKDWLGPEQTSLSTGIFSILTPLPVEELRTVVWAEGIYAAILTINGPGFEVTPLKILLIDLPSDPNRSRWQIAARLDDLLSKAEFDEPDLIVGDFNMPSNSRAFGGLFKGYARAWSESGEGWGPTYPREWPIARIDHVLVGPTVDVTSIGTIDPGRGRHRLQVFKVTAGSE